MGNSATHAVLSSRRSFSVLVGGSENDVVKKRKLSTVMLQQCLTTASMKAALITCEGKAMTCPLRRAFPLLI